MKQGDTQLARPQILYKNTKANIEALSGVVEGAVAYATDDNELGAYNGVSWDWQSVGAINASNVNMPKIGTPSIDNLAEDFTTRGSSGVIDGTLTYVEADAGAGTHHIKINAGEGYIRIANDQQAALRLITWAASTGIEIPTPSTGQETTRFIGIEYNSGSPQVTTRTTFNWNWFSDFPLARVSYDGTTLRILNAYAHAEDTANFARKMLRLTMPFTREEAPEGSGGLEIADVATRQISMTAGNIWHGFNRYILSAITAGTAFDTHYRRSGGGFNKTSGVTQWPNTKYDDNSGTLATMTNNRYACLWVYLDISDNSFDVIYGRGEYVTLVLAQAEGIPTVPDHLTYHGRLLGRIIFQKSASSASLFESAWNSPLNMSPVDSFDMAAAIHAATEKSTPENTDEFGFWDNITGLLRKVTWLGIKGTLENYFNGVFAGISKGVDNGNNHDHDTGDGGRIPTAGIANNAVTYAKMQNVSATDKVLGRSSAGSGNVEEITMTAAGRALMDDASAADQLVTLGAIPTSGWIEISSTWTRTNNHTFTISGDVTTIYRKGTKVRYKDGGSFEYGIVASSSYGAPNTTVTLITNNDYAMAAATITDRWISFVENPEGFPDYFNWTPTVSAGGSMTVTSSTINNAIFWAVESKCHFQVDFNADLGGTASNNILLSPPVTPLFSNIPFAANCRDSSTGAVPVGTGTVSASSGLIFRKADISNWTLSTSRLCYGAGFFPF